MSHPPRTADVVAPTTPTAPIQRPRVVVTDDERALCDVPSNDPRNTPTEPAPRFTDDAAKVTFISERTGLPDITVVELTSVPGVDLDGLVLLVDYGWRCKSALGHWWFDPSGRKWRELSDAVRIVRKDSARGDLP